jgi:aminopeptidase N
MLHGNVFATTRIVDLRTAGLLLAGLALAGCGDGGGDEGGEGDAPSSSPPPRGSASPDRPGTGSPEDVDEAVNQTREDSVYPDVGDPLVDALHYDLSLAWTPESDTLQATERLTFRATADADQVQLDFDDVLAVKSLTIDVEDTDFQRRDKDLVVSHAVEADDEYVLEMTYSGTPEPYDAPTQRSDFRLGVGWHVTPEHETWTIQEPYGAFTWYAANDQPADKAYYDFTLTVPEPWTGIANGELTDTTQRDGLRTTTWHLAEPASSYLVTVAFADYTPTELESAGGVPVTIWGPRDDPDAIGETEYAPEAMDWLEQYLGPYPFDTFGIVIYDGESGMETQTMVTLGDTEYATSKAVVVHELAHHWYGDTVTPADWSDVWMNEGMAMYLQGMWEAEDEGVAIDEKMDQWAVFESDLRAFSGPPGAYDPANFGDGNIYFGPALMWHELRQQIGDDAFFALLRDWPADQENDTADREEYLSWIEAETGEELSAFFDDWLLSETTPPRD